MTPEGGGTYGSMGSGSNAYGMELACKALKAKLQTIDRAIALATGAPEVTTGTMTNAQWLTLVSKALQAGVDLSVKSWGVQHLHASRLLFIHNCTCSFECGTYSSETCADHDLAVSGNGYGAAVAQIELDVLTGEIEILSADLLYDCGDSLSPEIDLGQVEGSFIIGVGHFLTEVSGCMSNPTRIAPLPSVCLISTVTSVLQRNLF